jgi:hypothetical protein
MSSDTWKSLHGKGRQNRPGLNEITAFLPSGVGELFMEFSRRMAHDFGVGCKPPVYTQTDGWVYSFGRYDVSLINRVTIEDGAFAVQDIKVYDADTFDAALAQTAALYADYKERFDRIVTQKKEKQKQNTKRRIERERSELALLSDKIDAKRFNRFRWSPKLSRQTVKRLYESDARGLEDEELVDEVGYTLYARCLQGRDERRLIESGRLKCHSCGEIHAVKGMAVPVECPCGQTYLFRDYMRSFRTDNMPSGAATAIFNGFVDKWPGAVGYAAKMRLVDGLIHEFHTNLNSGVKGRFVAVNLIEGTKKQISDLILSLAGGEGTEKFISNLRRE